MLHRNLPVFSGIAYILRCRTLNVREPLAQRGDNVARLIQADVVCVRYATRLGSGNVTDATSAGDPTTCVTVGASPSVPITSS